MTRMGHEKNRVLRRLYRLVPWVMVMASCQTTSSDNRSSQEKLFENTYAKIIEQVADVDFDAGEMYTRLLARNRFDLAVAALYHFHLWPENLDRTTELSCLTNIQNPRAHYPLRKACIRMLAFARRQLNPRTIALAQTVDPELTRWLIYRSRDRQPTFERSTAQLFRQPKGIHPFERQLMEGTTLANLESVLVQRVRLTDIIIYFTRQFATYRRKAMLTTDEAFQAATALSLVAKLIFEDFTGNLSSKDWERLLPTFSFYWTSLGRYPASMVKSTGIGLQRMQGHIRNFMPTTNADAFLTQLLVPRGVVSLPHIKTLFVGGKLPRSLKQISSANKLSVNSYFNAQMAIKHWRELLERVEQIPTYIPIIHVVSAHPSLNKPLTLNANFENSIQSYDFMELIANDMAAIANILNQETRDVFGCRTPTTFSADTTSYQKCAPLTQVYHGILAPLMETLASRNFVTKTYGLNARQCDTRRNWRDPSCRVYSAVGMFNDASMTQLFFQDASYRQILLKFLSPQVQDYQRGLISYHSSFKDRGKASRLTALGHFLCLTYLREGRPQPNQWRLRDQYLKNIYLYSRFAYASHHRNTGRANNARSYAATVAQLSASNPCLRSIGATAMNNYIQPFLMARASSSSNSDFVRLTK